MTYSGCGKKKGGKVSQVHVRYDGQSFDMTTEELDVGDLSPDTDIRNAVARHLGAPNTKLNGFAIDRNQETGDITLRPQAVFG